MELLSNLALGLTTAVTLSALAYCFTGVLLGTAIGVLPGLGPLATIAMLLPITYQIGEPVNALIMLAGIYYGAQYGGSTTAILINVPGEISSVVTTLDGYQMARQGRAGPALATAAIGSFAAGTLATIVIAAAAKPLSELAFTFGPAEYFSLMTLGLVGAVVLSHGSLMKAICMTLAGILVGTVGIDVNSGTTRFAFGFDELFDGVELAAVAIGVFGLSEILINLERGDKRETVTRAIGRLLPTREDLRRSVGPILRGAGLGSVLGVLPGGGSVLSSFSSYVLEKKISRHPERFGKGAIEGLAGPEAANNAGAQTSFIPMLTLGIPSNVVMALMIAAMMIHEITPGPQVIRNEPQLFWGLIVSMWVGNLMLLVLNLPLIGLWIRLLTIPYKYLYPAIVMFCAIGTYSMRNNVFDVWLILPFTVLGYMWRKMGCEAAPFLLGIVLGPMLEKQMRRAMIVSRGEFDIFIDRPISAALLGVTVLLLVLVALPMIAGKRREVFSEAEE
ncbi:MAG: tripartite tricarboxylate transporter permease [Pseudooceanicola sp.]